MAKRKLSVMIVDDNTSFIRRMVCLLKESDDICAIHTANNYNEALALLDKKPDLALLDIQLPGKNGMHILKRLKESAKDCEVIMLTNYAGKYYRKQCRTLGAQFFLDKTNEFELVAAKIKEIAMHDYPSPRSPLCFSLYSEDLNKRRAENESEERSSSRNCDDSRFDKTAA